MAFSCLKGCVTQYDRKGLRKPISQESMMPWVEMNVINGDKSISVSNFSSRKNRAVIKSFQFGMSNGQGVTIEVVDEDGGNFVNFFDKITTGNIDSSVKYITEFEFGWAVTGCDGFSQTYGKEACSTQAQMNGQRGMKSCKHRMVIRTVSVDVSHGAFKFTLECTDFTSDMFTTKVKKTYGTARNPMRIVPAIRAMFKEAMNVEVTFNEAGKNQPFKFKKVGDIDKGSVEGPMGVWPGMMRNPFQAARDWLNSCVSDRGRGIVSYWDSSPKGDPVLVFMESNQLTCKSKDMSDFNLGTYVVGGGNCSPVLSFTPQIRYTMAQIYQGTSGSAGGALGGRMFVEENPCPGLKDPLNTRLQGLRSTQGESDNDFRIFGNQATFLAGQAKMENVKANMFDPPYEADLKIQGDPSYDQPVLFQGYYVSVVHINPFRVANTATGCDWLAKTTCHNTLSNSNWMITKVYHEIREGIFQTTLKLRLAAPGLDLPYSEPLGGMPTAPLLPNFLLNGNNLPLV